MGGAYTNIGNVSSFAWSNGDTIALEVEGTSYSIYINDSLELNASNGSTPPTGSVGMTSYATDTRMDNWEGGDLTDPSQIKEVSNVAKASVKELINIPLANIKKVASLTN